MIMILHNQCSVYPTIPKKLLPYHLGESHSALKFQLSSWKPSVHSSSHFAHSELLFEGILSLSPLHHCLSLVSPLH